MKLKPKRIAAFMTASLISASSALSRQPVAADPPPGDAFAQPGQSDQPSDGTPRPGGVVGQRLPNGVPGPQGGVGVPGGQGGAGSAAAPPRQFSDRLQSLFRHGPGTAPAKALVIRTANGGSNDQAELEEDLAVMLRVLDNAAEEKGGGNSPARNAMGIDLIFSPGSSPIRSVYLDGYGALFILNVGFPLLPPPLAKPREERPPGDSSWEEAKRELHGTGPEGVRSPGEEFNPEKATRLEEALLEAVKNVVHIRGLKDDDTVTICVLGGGLPIPPRTGPQHDSDPFQRGPGMSGQSDQHSFRASTLTLRVKKADVEALAKGKLTPADFRKRASLVTGMGPATGGPLLGNWSGGGLFGSGAGFGGSGGGGGGGGFGGGNGGGGGNRP